MKNKNVIAVDIVLFIVFNVIAFLIPSELTMTFWVAYIFTIVMFGIQIYMWLSFFEKNPEATSKFYRIPVLSVCNKYLIIQIIVFLVFKFLPMLPLWVNIVVNVLVLAWALIGFITLSGAADYITAIDDKIKPKVSYIKSLQVEIELLAMDSTEIETKEILVELEEKLKYSDPMSDASVTELEEKISQNIVIMKKSDDEAKKKIAKDTIRLLEERNKRCKLCKYQ